MSSNKLIVALDVDELKKAQKLVDELKEVVSIFKIGSQLFTKEGPDVVKMVHKKKCRVFLDLKFHDIPNTVANAAEIVTSMGVFMFNVHVHGGRAMMRETALRAEKTAKKLKIKKPLIIGVTVLTSLDEFDIKELGIKRFLKDQALYLSKLAKEFGLDGVVSSAQEAKRIKQICGEDFKIICPGIRPGGAQLQDQKRVMTPKEAITQGADFLVIGRPIIEARNPVKVARQVVEEIEGSGQ